MINQIIVSQDRNLFGVNIRQRTEDSFLNLQDLITAYDKKRAENGWSVRRIEDITSGKLTSERIFYAFEDDVFINTTFSVFMKMTEEQGLLKVLKNFNLYRTTGRASNKTTWCHPIIWVYLAMEYNPQIYGKVIKWLADGLIDTRINCCYNHRPLNDSLKLKLNFSKAEEYASVSYLVNKKIFNEHYTGIRNNGNKEQLARLLDVEKTLTSVINLGFVSSKSELIQTLEKI